MSDLPSTSFYGRYGDPQGVEKTFDQQIAEVQATVDAALAVIEQTPAEILVARDAAVGAASQSANSSSVAGNHAASAALSALNAQNAIAHPFPNYLMSVMYPAKEQIMHRVSGAWMSPQNTLTASEYALNRGFTSIETDVQVTSDGVPVLFHDFDVDGLTDGSGPLIEKSLAQVKELDAGVKWGDGRYVGTRIPTLDEFLWSARGRMKRFYPEIKRYRHQSDIATMLNTIANHKMEDITDVASFNMGDLQYIRSVLMNPRVGLLFTSNTLNVPLIEQANALGGRVGFSLNYQFILDNPGIVSTIRSYGRDVCAWTVPDIIVANHLAKIGVTRVISDRPVIGDVV